MTMIGITDVEIQGQPLTKLRELARDCRNCPLWKNATQTVFGEGTAKAGIVLVGEQPGDKEDRVGKPFVGPAGALLDQALEEAGIDRSTVWVTNAVKHFKWKPRGKFRLHQKPSAGEIDACKPWLMAELSRIAPRVIVLMGATAVRSLLGRPLSVTKHRGELQQDVSEAKVILTIHPSYLLRIRDSLQREQEYRRFVEDFSLAV